MQARCTEGHEPRRLGLDPLAPDVEPHIAATAGVHVDVDAVLDRLLIGDDLEPDARTSPFGSSILSGPVSPRQLPGQLYRAVPRLHVDDVPPGDQVLGLDERPVGHRWPHLAVVPHEGAVGRQRLGVDELAAYGPSWP